VSGAVERLQRAVLLGRGGAGTMYTRRVKALLGSALLGHWPQWDTSGTVITDVSGNKFHGVYTNAVIGEAGIGDNRTSAKYPVTSFGNVYSAALAAAFNTAELSIVIWVKMASAAEWTDSAYHTVYRFRTDDNNMIYIQKTITNNRMLVGYVGGGTSKTIVIDSVSTLDWFCVAVTVSKANDRARFYVNGTLVAAEATGLGVWAGAVIASGASIGSRYGTSSSLAWLGWAAHAMLMNRELTDSEVAAVSSPFGQVKYLVLGDSKSAALVGWRIGFMGLMRAVGQSWVERPLAIAIGGMTAAGMAARCDADIAAMVDTPGEILINLGANSTPANAGEQATFVNNIGYVISAYHTACPNARIRLTKIWRQGVDLTFQHAGIDALYAANPWLSTGINEAFLAGADDGATYTTDGVHPNAAGHLLEAAAWKVAIVGA
jgi:lysophospholipase L1-like esterase